MTFAVAESGAVPPGPWEAIVVVDMLYLLPALEQRRLLTEAVAELAPGGTLVVKEMGTSPDNLAQVINATTGLNVVIRSLDLHEGDEILTTDHEYSALDKTWAFVARESGAKIVVVKVPLPLTSAQAFHDTLVAGMTARTTVVFLSHITSPTALLFPIESVIVEARKRGILSVIDGAHTPGHIPLDLDALGADFYSGNCHKWMMAPKGSGFVHARPEWQAMLDPLVISHGWTADNKEPGVRGPFQLLEPHGAAATRDRDRPVFLSRPEDRCNALGLGNQQPGPTRSERDHRQRPPDPHDRAHPVLSLRGGFGGQGYARIHPPAPVREGRTGDHLPPRGFCRRT